MQIWYETVRYYNEVHCPVCRRRLARRAANSPVFDTSGTRMEASDYDWGDDDRADYMTRCECGHELELKSPEDVEQLKSTAEAPMTGQPMVRLT